MFSNVMAIWKKELRSYFYTPLAYVFIGLFNILMAVMFFGFLRTYFAYTRPGQFGGGADITLDRLAEAFYANMHFILLIILPLYTFRLFTEETRQNTLVLLMTSPLKTWDIVLGKFKAAATVFLLMLSLTVVFPAFLVAYAEPGSHPDLGIVVSSYFGLLLVGLAYTSIGLFWSSVTESVLIALVLTFATNFLFGVLFQVAAQGVSVGGIKTFLLHLSFSEHFQAFLSGSVPLKSIVYLFGISFLFVFLTYKAIESRSWRA